MNTDGAMRNGGSSAFLVLGMHRSGTSAVAGMLTLLGLSSSSALMKPTPKNPRGYFESWNIVRLNNTMLAAAATRWNDWSPISDAWFDQASADRFAPQALEVLKQEFAATPAFVIKDPRMCRLLPVWLDALGRMGAKTFAILPIRHPDAVARSLMARDGVSSADSHLLWARHMLDAERGTRHLPRVFVDFDALLADWRMAVERIAAGTGFRWPLAPDKAQDAIDSFLDRRLCHHGPMPSPPMPIGRAKHVIGPAWETFSRMARGEDHAQLRASLDGLRDDLGRIPSAYRLPLGLDAIGVPIIRLWLHLRARLVADAPKGDSPPRSL